MALMHSTMVPLREPAHEFSLPGVDGRQYTLDSFKNKRILVVIFMCNHCPYVKAVLSRLIDLQNQMAAEGVQLVGINSNDATRYPDDSLENMKKISEEKKIPFPYLFDETQEIAKAYDAVCTPDIYVYGEDRTLLYRGRIDDNWEVPEKVTRTDLKEAVEAALAGEKITEEQIPSMGCSIKWKQN
ncbi:MAG: thioredoxin family protein [Nitrospinaceae bacterium]|nr:MAG: thioredoxin family protein [Nitrospinaceae bacterium]